MIRVCASRLLIAASLVIASCSTQSQRQDEIRARAEAFLGEYVPEYQRLAYEDSQAAWESNTRIVEGDTLSAYRERVATQALADFTGSVENIEAARALYSERDLLLPLQARQVGKALYMAANNPQTIKDVVEGRIRLEVELNQGLYGFEYQIDGEAVTTNEIDRRLRAETDLARRLATWQASKEVGLVLTEGLAELRDLRNESVRALGYQDFFSYQVSDYGMSSSEMLSTTSRMNDDLFPLYQELHTWARYELAARYGAAEVPDLIPAHWLPNRWGQEWTPMVRVEGADLDASLQEVSPQDLVRRAEEFYVSLGFDPLPESFYEKSSLYPVPPDAGYKKNNHASAWHLDLDQDVRSLMSVQSNSYWYETTHHELGHIYYCISYTRPEVPLLLRRGANRAFHEAIGSQMGLASMQRPFLVQTGILDNLQEADEIQLLLKEALSYVVFIPWAAGVMTEFENDLYAGELPPDQFNSRWWDLKARYQGITPPSERPSASADAATKTHIINDPAQYYDYALSFLILFQLHDYISREILDQSPRATNYYGNKQVGDFLRGILSAGATRDWRELLHETVGSDISAEPMVRYFEPLLEWLRKQNEGREHTLSPPAS